MKATIEFNINEHIMVKLNDEGKLRLKRKGLLATIKEDAEGWSKWQLWNLFNTLPVGLGSKLPFDALVKMEIKNG